MKPLGGPLIHGRGAVHHHLVCHCLVLELGDRLVLVDTGFGSADVQDPVTRLGRMFLGLTRPDLHEARTVAAQLRALALDPKDVRDIVVTHMDVDHIGGLCDFPWARVHVMRREFDRAQRRPSAHDRARYRPIQWSHGVDWARYEEQGEPWYGFDAVRDLEGLPPEVLLIPLAGHSAGHTAVAIDSERGWLLHCGDAYFHRDEVETPPGCPWGLRVFERMVADDDASRRNNVQRLRELARRADADVRLFCAHDPAELDAMGRPSSS